MTDQLREAALACAELMCIRMFWGATKRCPEYDDGRELCATCKMRAALDAAPPAAIRPVTRYRRTADQMYPDPEGQWLHVSDAGVKAWLLDPPDATPPAVDVEAALWSMMNDGWRFTTAAGDAPPNMVAAELRARLGDTR
jgi:hypothetical protein